MTDFTPTPEAVEAVAKALIGCFAGFPGKHYPVSARAAIAAFVEAEELTVESPVKPNQASVLQGVTRLVGPWRKRDS